MYALNFSRKIVRPYTDRWLSIFLGEIQLFVLMFPYSDFFSALPQYSALNPLFTVLSSLCTLGSIIFLLHSSRINVRIKDHSWLLIVMGYFAISSLWIDPVMKPENIFFLTRTSFTIIQSLVIIQVFAERHEGAFLDTLKKVAIIMAILSFLFMIIYPEQSNWNVKDPVRDESFFASPNNLGQFLAFAFIIINFYKRKEVNLLFLIILNGLLIYQALRCNSMTSQLGVMICFAAYHFKKILRPLYYIILVLGIGLPIFTHLNSDPNAEKTKFADRDLTFTGRSDVWEVLINDLNTNNRNLIGFGAGGYWGNEPGDLQAMPKSTIGDLEWARQGHNGYLDIRVMGGVIGLSLVIFFIIHFVALLYRKKDTESVLLFIPFIVCINNMTESSLFRNKHIYFLLFMLIYWYANQVKDEIKDVKEIIPLLKFKNR